MDDKEKHRIIKRLWKLFANTRTRTHTVELYQAS